MNILILGSGGREHSIAWAVRQNPKCDRLLIAPGNAGTQAVAENVSVDINDGAAVVALARAEAIDFVIVGPEAPLAAGVADALRVAGILTFGPSAAAAQLEASKSFTKDICTAANAPTAAAAHFTDKAAAAAYLAAHRAPIVLKADGLAAGKGVIVAMTDADATAALDTLMSDPGAELVIEEFMTGEEASFFCLVNGTDVLPVGTAQDHKRAFDGDEGPNTGGMGAYSPAPVLNDDVAERALAEIVRPTMAEMVARGTPFQGVLYVGLMIEDGAPRLVEYNVRFGDPECQVLMMRLGGQILDLLQACAEDRLSEMTVNWANDHALSVVLAAQGYPGDYEKGSAIKGLDALPQGSKHQMFHAGTSGAAAAPTASGGRVLNATARGATLQEARDAAYAMADAVDWPDGFYRRDIGHRALS